jgi:hypothetical protein
MLDPRPERRPSAASVLGGLDGTSVTGITVPHQWRGRLRRDPARRVAGRNRRRALASLTAALALAGGVWAAVQMRGGTPAAPAPHTNGKACAAGWYNLDGVAANGCEAHSDYTPGATLTQQAPLHANLVPPSVSDSFRTHVSGNSLNFCWGSLHITLTAPARTAEQLTVSKGTTKVATALSANGAPATAAVHKPSCFGADSEDLLVTVSAVAATGNASANDFTLTRDGGW